MGNNAAANTNKKQRGRPFKQGQSGNPKGRPQGSRNNATLAAQTLLDGEAEKLTRVAVDLALNGDQQALRLCLERLLPAKRERPVAFEIPGVGTIGELPLATSAILKAVASGDITPGEAEKLGSLITSHGKILELIDLDSRLSKIEKHLEELK